jgi:hypothetical protein
MKKLPLLTACCFTALALTYGTSACAYQPTGPTTIIISNAPTGPTETTPTLVLTTQILDSKMLQSYFSQLGLGRLDNPLENGDAYSTTGSPSSVFSGLALTKDKIIFFTPESIALYMVPKKDALMGIKCIDLSNGEIIGIYSTGVKSGDTTVWTPFAGSKVQPGYYGLNVYADNNLVAIYPFAMAIE